MIPAPSSPLDQLRVSDGLLRALHPAIVALLVVELIRSAARLRANEALYSPAVVEWIGFSLLVVVTIAVWRLNIRGLDGRRGLLTALTLLASVAATAAVPPGSLFTSAHWSWYVIGWFLVAVDLGQSIRSLVQVLGLHLALVIGQTALQGWTDKQGMAELTIRGLAYTGAQITFGIAGFAAQRASDAAARIQEREARRLTTNRIADEVMRDQRARHETVAGTAVPLLRGLAGGALSPDDPEVRRRSMVEATRLRRLMAEADQSPNPLNHELRACVDVAERSGVQVDVAFRGDGPEPGVASRRRLTEPLITVLATAMGTARVTVVGTANDVVVSVLAAVAPGTEVALEDVPAPGPDDVIVTVTRSSGQIWVTARWEAA